ncbi:MAG: phosphate uptake regulator PhoU [Phycisphaerales bacterium]
MQGTSNGFKTRLDRLKADIVEQSRRVQAMIEAAFDAAFAMDAAQGDRVIKMDESIDKVDVEIERASVTLLSDACAAGAQLPPEQVRLILTIVKVNNELERIADVGVSIAEQIRAIKLAGSALPETFRVMSNSVIGILHEVSVAMDRIDGKRAQQVLASEDAIEAFKKSILRDAQVRVSKGVITVDQAFSLLELATYCEIMAGHCTNIAEQVLYVATGQIVRHLEGHWEKFELPG